MLTYVAVSIYGLITLLFLNKYRVKGINIKIGFLLVMSILMIFTEKNPDYYTYYYAYTYGIRPFYENGISYISDILGILGISSYKVFLILVMFLICTVFNAWTKYVKNIHHVIFIYSLFIMYYDCIQIRNTIAAFLIILALLFAIEKKRIMCIILCIVSVSFHRLAVLTGLIALYVMFIEPQKEYQISRKEVLVVCVGGLITAVSAIPIINAVAKIIPILHRVLGYLSTNVSIDSYVIWIMPAILYIVTLWFCGIKKLLSSDAISAEKKRVINILFRYSLLKYSLSILVSKYLSSKFSFIYILLIVAIFLRLGIKFKSFIRVNVY